MVKMCRSGVLDGQHFCFVFLVLAWLGVGGGGGCVPQQPQNYEKMSQKKNTKKQQLVTVLSYIKKLLSYIKN